MNVTISIDTTKIPPLERRLLGLTFYEAMQKFYENPENVRRFKEWQKAKKRENKIK